MPEGVPRITEIALDLRVLAAAAGLSLVTGIALRHRSGAAVVQARPDERAQGRRRGGERRRRRARRLRSALVVAEVALAVVLLVGAALFIGSFVTLMRIDPGFDPERVLTVQISPRSEPGKPPPDSVAVFTELVERISQVPGVAYASLISGGMPLGGSMSTTDITVPGRKVEDNEGVSIRRVTPDYHEAMGIALKSGRLFEAVGSQGWCAGR